MPHPIFSHNFYLYRFVGIFWLIFEFSSIQIYLPLLPFLHFWTKNKNPLVHFDLMPQHCAAGFVLKFQY